MVPQRYISKEIDQTFKRTVTTPNQYTGELNGDKNNISYSLAAIKLWTCAVRTAMQFRGHIKVTLGSLVRELRQSTVPPEGLIRVIKGNVCPSFGNRAIVEGTARIRGGELGDGRASRSRLPLRTIFRRASGHCSYFPRVL